MGDFDVDRGAAAADATHSHSNSSAAGGPGFASPQSVVTSATEANSKNKSALVVQAEAMDRDSALLRGYVRKHNSQGRWQKRWFEIVGHFWVYYKTDRFVEP